MPSLSQAEFAVLLHRAGLGLSDAEIGDLYQNGFLPFQAMAENVRGGGTRSREAEPSHIFSVDDRA
jgi:hypothetical protein